jgi:hypothetical protein
MTTTMPGIGLGRVFDVVGVAAAHRFSLQNAQAVSFIAEASGASTITVQASKTYSGSLVNWTTANGFGQPATWYQNTANDGTAAWTKQTASWSTATLTLAGTSGYMSVVTFLATQFADGYKYIDISSNANNTFIVALLHDLSVQRTPANLAILGA